ncbi:hypothetical protein HDU87_005553 [Geranomyces variabilis]|uniref:Mitochondrial mRNA-processing protein COX24 C-terminal domain-containing protein n=1 Tax=Geranomyces variabilis TaxID=109894 RepID=A0AAD5TID4_9FUNG|nr:hypothetical protein HDU87_005553 [Geranomyces variabilis]
MLVVAGLQRPLAALPRASAAAARHALASRSLTTTAVSPTTSLAPAFLPYPLHAAPHLHPPQPPQPPLPTRSAALSPFLPTASPATASTTLTIDNIFAPLLTAAAPTTPSTLPIADALMLARPRQPAMHMISILKRRRMKMKKHKWKKGRKAVRDSTRYNRERRKKGGVQREKQE